jgi:hypothetical protein
MVGTMPEDRSSMLLRNVGTYVPKYSASHHTRFFYLEDGGSRLPENLVSVKVDGVTSDDKDYSALQIEATGSSETPISFYPSTLHHM